MTIPLIMFGLGVIVGVLIRSRPAVSDSARDLMGFVMLIVSGSVVYLAFFSFVGR